MANAEHLDILKQGVEVWNRWREENENIEPDLIRADLHEEYLCGINFANVKLGGVDLSWADLEGANLTNAALAWSNMSKADASSANFTRANLAATNFIGTTLKNAKLMQVNLFKANLTNSNLSKANLTESNFEGVILNESKLKNTIFNRCYIDKTAFTFVDLSRVSGLETIVVGGECSIDFQTLRASPNLPKTFLRKIGLPENYINYLPDFFDKKPIRMHPAFLSHSSKDKPFATKLYEALITRKVLVWYDERKLLPGDNLIEGISKGIDLYDKFILVCSKQSLQESWWVDKELNRALDKEIRLFKEKGRQINTIIPIAIDDYVFKEWDGAKRSDIHRYNIGDFTGWQDDAKFELALDKLVAALNADRGGEEVVSYL